MEDIKTLIEYGYEIIEMENEEPEFYLGKRDFEVWELKVLIDAVWQAKFLTDECSESITERLKEQTGEDSKRLLSAVFPIKADSKISNSTVKNNIELILTAIRKKKQIQFQYTYTDEKLKKQYRKEGKFYIINPYLFVWKDDRYYLICNTDNHDSLAYYRLDRIENLEISNAPVRPLTDVVGANAEQKVNEFVETSVYRFTGEKIQLVIRVNNTMIDELIDYFGENLKIKEHYDLFDVTVTVMDTKGLYYWLLQHGESIEVIKPKAVREEFTQMLEKIYKKHRIGIDYESLDKDKSNLSKKLEKSKKIIVFGDLRFKKSDIAVMVKDFGLEFDQFEFHDYDEVKNYDFSKLKGSKSFGNIFFGPVPHRVKTKNTKNYSSIIAQLEAENSEYPTITRLNSYGGKLKITKKSFMEAIERVCEL